VNVYHSCVEIILSISCNSLSMIFLWPPFFAIIVAVVVGAYYKEKLRKKYNSDVTKYNSLASINMQADNFNSGLFDCLNGHKSTRKCCFACFCPSVRWAADASATGFMDFWIALIISSIFMTFMFILGFIGRIHIRAQSNMQKSPVGDFFSWCCCYPCALTQEAKFVDGGFRAIRDGVSVAELEQQLQTAGVVTKPPEPVQPPTPETTTPPTPEPAGPAASSNIQSEQ
jgi:Cys-rich protein (TIGR01571 family)